MEPTQITISREKLAEASMMFDLLQQAREQGAPIAGEILSHSSRKPRSFMDPQAARMFGQDGRGYVGGHVHRDWGQMFNQPTASDVHVDAIMTQISVRYRNEELIGDRIFPRVQVANRSDKYFIFGASPWLRNDVVARAPGAAARRSGYTLSTGNYSVETYSQEHQVPDEVRRNADNPLNPDRHGAEFVTDLVNLKLEKQVATLVNTSANWSTNVTLSGTSQWSDYSNSDPFDIFKTARQTVLTQVAKRANTAVMGYQVFETLALHPDLLDRVKYTGSRERPAMVTAQMMAELFQVEQVLVGSAIEDTAIEGATASIAFVWGKHAWLGFVASQASLDTPSAGYVFTTGRLADRYREDGTKSDIIRVEEAWDTKAVAAGAGYRIVNAVA